MQIHLKKNEAIEIVFAMVDSTTPANFKTGESPADDGYYKDGAGAWTALAIADTAAEIASTGYYEISLTAAEMNHDYIAIKFTAASSQDTLIVIRTYGVDIDDVSTFTAGSDTVTLASATHTGAVIPTVTAVTDAVTVGTINTDVIAAASLSAAAAEKLTDILLRRNITTVRASSFGDSVAAGSRNLLAGISKLVNRVKLNSVTGNLEVYDDTDAGTPILTQTYTASTTASPITEVDTD